MSDAIRVNGNLFSWGSLIFILDDQRYYGFTSISFGDKREYALGYSMARHHAPIGRSAGKYTPDVLKVGGHRHSVRDLKKAIAAKSADQRSYGNVEFNGLLQYIETDQTEITVQLARLKWASNTTSHDESPDNLKGEFELSALYYIENDLTLFDATDGMP